MDRVTAIVWGLVALGAIFVVVVYWNRRLRTARRIDDLLEKYFQGRMPVGQLGQLARAIAGHEFFEGPTFFSLAAPAFQRGLDPYGVHTTRIRVIVHRVPRGRRFLLLREARKENPSRRKENPSLREGKSKPRGRKIQALSFRELSLFKGLRGALGRFSVPVPILPLGLRRPPPRRRQINPVCLVKPCRDRRRLLIERSTLAWIQENGKANRARRSRIAVRPRPQLLSWRPHPLSYRTIIAA